MLRAALNSTHRHRRISFVRAEIFEEIERSPSDVAYAVVNIQGPETEWVFMYRDVLTMHGTLGILQRGFTGGKLCLFPQFPVPQLGRLPCAHKAHVAFRYLGSMITFVRDRVHALH